MIRIPARSGLHSVPSTTSGDDITLRLERYLESKNSSSINHEMFLPARRPGRSLVPTDSDPDNWISKVFQKKVTLLVSGYNALILLAISMELHAENSMRVSGALMFPRYPYQK